MDEQMKAFLSLMHRAHSDAKDAHKYSFNDPESAQKEDRCTALSYANACTARLSAAEALYWSCLGKLEHPELPELFRQFHTFTDEIRNDYAIDHSRQWVEIEFDNLEELFQNSVCNQAISE